MDKYEAVFYTILAILTLLISFGFGMAVGKSVVVNDCDQLGKFANGWSVYECRVITTP